MALIQASIEQLRVGHYIHLPTGWTSHPFMFNAFKIKDQQQLDIIRHLDLTLLMVDPDKSDLPVEPLLRAEPVPSLEMSDTGDTAPSSEGPTFDEKAFRRSLRIADKAFGQSLSDLRDALGALNLKPDEGLANTAQIVRSTAARLAEHQGPLGLHLIRSQNTDTLLQHSLSVAFIAMLVARELGMNPVEIEETGLAGLIHDIGELRIPSQIIQKRGEPARRSRISSTCTPSTDWRCSTSCRLSNPGSARSPTCITNASMAAVFPSGSRATRSPPRPPHRAGGSL